MAEETHYDSQAKQPVDQTEIQARLQQMQAQSGERSANEE
jgi:hypothetical protein